MASQILGALLVGAPAIIGAVNQNKANQDAKKYCRSGESLTTYYSVINCKARLRYS